MMSLQRGGGRGGWGGGGGAAYSGGGGRITVEIGGHVIQVAHL